MDKKSDLERVVVETLQHRKKAGNMQNMDTFDEASLRRSLSTLMDLP